MSSIHIYTLPSFHWASPSSFGHVHYQRLILVCSECVNILETRMSSQCAGSFTRMSGRARHGCLYLAHPSATAVIMGCLLDNRTPRVWVGRPWQSTWLLGNGMRVLLVSWYNLLSPLGHVNERRTKRERDYWHGKTWVLQLLSWLSRRFGRKAMTRKAKQAHILPRRSKTANLNHVTRHSKIEDPTDTSAGLITR